MDVSNTFLHGKLNEAIYMHQPLGFINNQFPHHVCRLKLSLYGLKQVPIQWFKCLTSALQALGFKGSQTDSSLFYYSKGSTTIFCFIYVDDLILTSSSTQFLQHVVVYNWCNVLESCPKELRAHAEVVLKQCQA